MNRRIIVKVCLFMTVICVALMLAGPKTQAATSDGALDPTFGSGGVVKTSFDATTYATATSLVRQPDGKIVVAGEAGGKTTVVRYNPNGTVDTNFGTNGQFIYSLLRQANAVALTADGKLIIGGMVASSPEKFGLIRLLSNGTLDSSFGLVSTSFDTYNAAINTVIIQPDGKILVGGNASLDIAMARYNSNGALDDSFGLHGTVYKPINYNGQGNIAEQFDLSLTPDGKIILVGDCSCNHTGSGPANQGAILRFNADGSLDSTFGSSGVVIASLGSYPTKFYAVALQSDGKIVAAGSLNNACTSGKDCDDFAKANDYDVYVARYTADGQVDRSFADSGHATFDFGGGFDSTQDVAVQADGTIVLAGMTGPLWYAPNVNVLRLRSNGDRDPGFGTNGNLITNVAGQTSAMMIQPDSKIVVAGTTTEQEANEYMVLRVQNSVSANTTTATPPINGTRTPTVTLTPTNTSTPYDTVTPIDSQTSTPTKTTSVTNSPTVIRTQSATAVTTSTATRTQTSVPGATNTPGAFSDVQPSDYFYTPVQYLAGHGIISGYSDNTFRPYNNTTRGQLAKIAVLGFGLPVYTPPAGAQTFSDVAPADSFFNMIESAAHAGIISGYADHTFRPGSNVTRGQLAKIIVGAAGWQLTSPTTPTFSDVLRDNPFYSFVETAVAHGIISGYDVTGGKEFRPGAAATRGQIAKIVYLSIVH